MVCSRCGAEGVAYEVRSDISSIKVCFDCANVAARLKMTAQPNVQGAIEVVPLTEEKKCAVAI